MLKWSHYWKQSKDSMQPLSKLQWRSLQNWEKKNPKVCLEAWETRRSEDRVGYRAAKGVHSPGLWRMACAAASRQVQYLCGTTQRHRDREPREKTLVAAAVGFLAEMPLTYTGVEGASAWSTTWKTGEPFAEDWTSCLFYLKQTQSGSKSLM